MIPFKSSLYNVFQPYQDSVLAYNSISDRFLVLNPLLYELFKASVDESNIAGLKEVHADFFDSLRENGFIVPEEKDEYGFLRDEIIKVDNDTSLFRLIINPTMNCNFKCWYCYESHIKGSKMTPDNIDKVYKLIDKVLDDERINDFRLSWFGGEPLLYYRQVMLPILQYGAETCRDKGVNFLSNVTTNGLLITTEMVNEFIQYNLKGVQITLDGSRKLHDKIRFVSKNRGSYGEIMKNVLLLCDNKVYVILRINFTSETLEEITDIIHDLSALSDEKRKFLKVSFHQVWQTKEMNNLSYSNELRLVKQKFIDANFNVASSSSRSMIYNSCYADKRNEVVVNYNGDIFKCTAREFTKENREGIINDRGEVEWNTRHKSRMMAKLNNRPCQECPILPLCGSGCSQVAFESKGEDYCVHDFDMEKKKQVVKEHFLETIAH